MEPMPPSPRGRAPCPGRRSSGKVAKPLQDMRFDVPTIGQSTLETAIEAGIQAIALEAGKTIVMDKGALIRRADAAGVAIALVDEENMGSAGM